MPPDELYMKEALLAARAGMEGNLGGPFGAVVVYQGEIVGRGCNSVTSTNDPTAHAEIMAIREAGRKLGRFELRGCRIYSSCEPCPMCLAAIYWARLDHLTFAGTREDAAQAGFDDDYFYKEMALSLESRTLPSSMLLRSSAQDIFKAWTLKSDKVPY